MRPALIIVGKFGSGKTTLAGRLAKELGAYTYEMGQYALRRFARQDQFLTPVEFADAVFSRGHLTKFAEDAVAEIMTRKNENHALSIVVGPRKVAELDFFRQKLYVISTIGLTAPDNTRFARHMNESKIHKSFDYLRMRDAIENRWGVNDALEACDVLLDSRDSTEFLVRHIHRLVVETTWRNANG